MMLLHISHGIIQLFYHIVFLHAVFRIHHCSPGNGHPNDCAIHDSAHSYRVRNLVEQTSGTILCTTGQNDHKLICSETIQLHGGITRFLHQRSELSYQFFRCGIPIGGDNVSKIVHIQHKYRPGAIKKVLGIKRIGSQHIGLGIIAILHIQSCDHTCRKNMVSIFIVENVAIVLHPDILSIPVLCPILTAVTSLFALNYIFCIRKPDL